MIFISIGSWRVLVGCSWSAFHNSRRFRSGSRERALGGLSKSSLLPLRLEEGDECRFLHCNERHHPAALRCCGEEKERRRVSRADGSPSHRENYFLRRANLPCILCLESQLKRHRRLDELLVTVAPAPQADSCRHRWPPFRVFMPRRGGDCDRRNG